MCFPVSDKKQRKVRKFVLTFVSYSVFTVTGSKTQGCYDADIYLFKNGCTFSKLWIIKDQQMVLRLKIPKFELVIRKENVVLFCKINRDSHSTGVHMCLSVRQVLMDDEEARGGRTV